MLYIIDTNKPFDGCIIAMMSDDKYSDYGGETLEELQERNPTSNLVAIDTQTYDSKMMQHRQKLQEEPFKEITRESYEDMFGCVPPERTGRNWFFVGEPYHWDLFTLCFTDGTRY